MISTKQFEHDLRDLEPDAFEQLVHSIVRRTHPNAQKVKAPDFGADIVDDPASRRPLVWQVKHYPGPSDINWTECAKSLNRAVAKWRPREVIFVFPRDLTGKGQHDFNDTLVAKHAIPVTRWTASDVNDMLERHPAIRRSYFPHRTDELHQILRAARLTETPTTGPAFLEHGLDLAALTEELDPHFDYELRARPDHLPQATWDQPPFMTVRARGAGKESIIAAFAKPEAPTPEASWGFTGDEAGEEARRRVYDALARGEPFELSGGITVRATPAPAGIKVIYDHIEAEGSEGKLVLTVTPSVETVPLRVRLVDASPRSTVLDFPMRAAPPKPGDDAGWVGRTAGILLYVGFREPTAGSVKLQFSPTIEQGTSAGTYAMGTATMLELLSHPLRVEGPLVAGEAELDLRSLAQPDDLQRLRFLSDVYAAVIEIEARTGTRIRVPDALGGEAATDALNLAQLLRNRWTTGRSELKITLHLPPEHVRPVVTRVTDTRQITVPFEQDLMDQTVRYGWARITFERVSATVQPSEPGALVAVRLEADGRIELQLIDEPLPSDVRMDLVIGKWNTALAPSA